MSIDRDLVITTSPFLTVEEAAVVLRIGRTAAYELAREFLANGGSSGLPVIRMGRQLRVPRAALEALAGGPIVCTPATHPSKPDAVETKATRSRRRRGPQQPSFPFEA
jgi:excisionase family DNA binding protein